MRNFIIATFATVLFFFSAMVSMAFAEDNSLHVEMPRNAKVGHTEMHMSYERLADGDTWESTITCTKISAKVTKCVSSDELGWNQTIVCVSGKCNTVAAR